MGRCGSRCGPGVGCAGDGIGGAGVVGGVAGVGPQKCDNKHAQKCDKHVEERDGIHGVCTVEQ